MNIILLKVLDVIRGIAKAAVARQPFGPVTRIQKQQKIYIQYGVMIGLICGAESTQLDHGLIIGIQLGNLGSQATYMELKGESRHTLLENTRSAVTNFFIGLEYLICIQKCR